MSTDIVPAVTGTSPIVGRLKAIFDALPDADLLATLRGPQRRGRPGYDAGILWRCFVTYYALGIESVSALLRTLRDNPFIAEACAPSNFYCARRFLSVRTDWRRPYSLRQSVCVRGAVAEWLGAFPARMSTPVRVGPAPHLNQTISHRSCRSGITGIGESH